jgi:hypothetical protein
MAVRHPDIREIRSLIEGELDQIRSSIVREHIRRCDKCAAVWGTALGLVLDRFESVEGLSTGVGECPDPETLAAYQSGDLVEDKRECVERHLTQCSLCVYSLKCLDAMPEGSEEAGFSVSAEGLAFLEDRTVASAFREVFFMCSDMALGLLGGIVKIVNASANAMIQGCLAVRQWRFRRKIAALRNEWEELGRELQSAAVEDISPRLFDGRLLRLEARISRHVEAVRYMESRTDGQDGYSEEVDTITDFMRYFVSQRIGGTLARGEACIMKEEWNGHYWFLSELMTTARPVRTGQDKSVKGGRKAARSKLKGGSDVWQIAASVAAMLLFATALNHVDWIKASLAQSFWQGSDHVAYGIDNVFFTLKSLISHLHALVFGLRLDIQAIINRNRDLVTFISVIVVPLGMYFLFKLMPIAPRRQTSYAQRR